MRSLMMRTPKTIKTILMMAITNNMPTITLIVIGMVMPCLRCNGLKKSFTFINRAFENLPLILNSLFIQPQGFIHQFNQILDNNLSFQTRGFDGISEHHQVFWTSRHQRGHTRDSSRFSYSTFSGSFLNFGLF